MIAIVIPVHNRIQFTVDCLNSLRKQTYKDFKVIVVDDGSTDGTTDILAKDFPEVKVLMGDGNLFWTAAINRGVAHALKSGVSYILSLNNDTLAREDFLEKMFYWAIQKPEALMGALALDYKTGNPVYGGAVLDWRKNTNRYLLEELSPGEHKGLHPVNHFPGRGLWIPACVFKKTGLFNENVFPHYYADYDFTHKATLTGFEVYCNFDAVIYTYPKESGDYQNRKVKNLNNYYHHLFGIKGGGNLKNFTRFAFKNCPLPYLPYFLISGYVRRIFGYLIK